MSYIRESAPECQPFSYLGVRNWFIYVGATSLGKTALFLKDATCAPVHIKYSPNVGDVVLSLCVRHLTILSVMVLDHCTIVQE
jgi:hypothetical protein